VSRIWPPHGPTLDSDGFDGERSSSRHPRAYIEVQRGLFRESQRLTVAVWEGILVWSADGPQGGIFTIRLGNGSSVVDQAAVACGGAAGDGVFNIVDEELPPVSEGLPYLAVCAGVKRPFGFPGGWVGCWLEIWQ
jgi:hypothetical protein